MTYTLNQFCNLPTKKIGFSTKCYHAKFMDYFNAFPEAHFEIISLKIPASTFLKEQLIFKKNVIWSPVLAPTEDLLLWMKQNKPTFRNYTLQFKLQILNDKKAIERMKELIQIAQKKQVFLICYEKDASQCHRSLILKEIYHIINMRTILKSI